MSDTQGRQLPPGWAEAGLGAIGRLICGQSPTSSTVNREGRGIIYVSGPEHWDGAVVHTDKWTTSPARIVPKGTVFITVKGAGVGTIFPGIEAAIGRDIYAFLPADVVPTSFVTHALRFTTSEIVRQAQGDIPGLSKDHILNHRIAIPPVEEQQRIANKIDELLSDLDAGVAGLKRIQAKLKHYRAAVLKAAVDGTLTADWRIQHPDTEPGSELLQRILSERRRRWEEAQLEEFKATSKPPPKDWKAKYQEPAVPDSKNLPPLPEGWCWATPKLLGSVQLGRQRAPIHHQGDFMRPYLRVANVYEDRIDLGSVYEMNFSPEQFTSYELHTGDILLNEGQSLELVGRSAIYRGELPGACFTNTLVRFRPSQGLKAEFAQTYFRACLRNHRFRKLARWTTNIAHLGADRFAAMEFPLPPLAEQEAIVEAVEDQLSVIDHLDADLQAKLDSAQALRQSILRHAFTGQLVPQDPNDEPATELIKRIVVEREERTRQAAAAKQTTKKAKPAKVKPKTPRRRAAAVPPPKQSLPKRRIKRLAAAEAKPTKAKTPRRRVAAKGL